MNIKYINQHYLILFLKNALYLWKNIYKQINKKWKDIYNGNHNLFCSATNTEIKSKYAKDSK
jgi:hypothetical protein